MDNVIVWADIPVTDLDRAMKFYSQVLQREFTKVEGMDGIAVEAPSGDTSQMEPGQYPVSFDLALVAQNKPGTDGPTIYVNSHGDPEGMMERAKAAGGREVVPVTDMGDVAGINGIFIDSEGNRIGVHKDPERMAA